MRITIEIEDGGTSIRTTESAVPAQPGMAETVAGATAPAAARTTAAALGSRDGGPAPSGPGGHGPAAFVPGFGSGTAAESGAPGAPEAFLRLTPALQAGGVAAGAAPGAPPVPAHEVEQGGEGGTAAPAAERAAEDWTPPGKAGRPPRPRR